MHTTAIIVTPLMLAQFAPTIENELNTAMDYNNRNSKDEKKNCKLVRRGYSQVDKNVSISSRE